MGREGKYRGASAACLVHCITVFVSLGRSGASVYLYMLGGGYHAVSGLNRFCCRSSSGPPSGRVCFIVTVSRPRNG